MEKKNKEKKYVHTLLDRIIPEEYASEWTEILKNEKGKIDRRFASILIFRLGNELFALPTISFKEILKLKTIHPIPHQKNSNLIGIVSLNGELQPCISLHSLLQVNATSLQNNKNSKHEERMIAITKDNLIWVFPVEEIKGIALFDLSQMTNVPVNVVKLKFSYVKGILHIDNTLVSLIDDELLFYSLKTLI